MKTTKKFTKKPLFESPFADKSEYCEKLSDKPVQTFIPHQAITLKELVTRFEHGQRLNVHQNFAPGSNFTNDSVYEEDTNIFSYMQGVEHFFYSTPLHLCK